ncbi:hypothetical protein ACIBH1_04685 [Nonomuraea sp. NPDC050663]|uniref:hypothetical protein n=1 Tax=Nonomuraea sp. NPDC050663 TaxID=3364370 RepID=UPI0037B1FB19
MRIHLDGARERGARPVLLTSVERRSAEPAHGRYPQALKEPACSEGRSPGGEEVGVAVHGALG